MKTTEQPTGQSPLSLVTDQQLADYNLVADMQPDEDENETGIEDDDDLGEVRVGDDLHEPDPEGDYLSDDEALASEEPDPVPRLLRNII